MCGEFGEVSGIIDLVINFLAAGTLFLDALASLVLVMTVGEQVFSWDILNWILVQHDIQTKRSIDIFTLGGNNYAR